MPLSRPRLSSERISPASQPACDVRSNAAHRHMAAARCCKRRETSRRLERRSSRPIGRLVGVLGDRGKRLRLTNTWHHSNAAGSPRQSGRTSASLNQERGSFAMAKDQRAPKRPLQDVVTVEMSLRIGPHCGEHGWGIPASPRPILRARRVNSRAVGPAVLVRHVAQLVRGRSGQAEPRSSSGRRRRAVALPWDASPFYHPLDGHTPGSSSLLQPGAPRYS